MTCLTRFVACATALFLGVTCASADPVRVTSGFLLVTGNAVVAPIDISGTQGFLEDSSAGPRSLEPPRSTAAPFP
jgi:hypothetical protein